MRYVKKTCLANNSELPSRTVWNACRWHFSSKWGISGIGCVWSCHTTSASSLCIQRCSIVSKASSPNSRNGSFRSYGKSSPVSFDVGYSAKKSLAGFYSCNRCHQHGSTDECSFSIKCFSGVYPSITLCRKGVLSNESNIVYYVNYYIFNLKNFLLIHSF